MIKAIIFDFGGVLVRTEDTTPREALDRQLGLPPGSVQRAVHASDLWVQAQLGRVTYKTYWDGVAEMLRLKPADMPAIREAYFGGDRLDADLVALIRELRGQGLRTALLSNDIPELADKLRDLKIADLFDHTLISARIGVMKPDPTAYRVALQALEVEGEEAVFVDDLPANVYGARSLGINAILFHAGLDLRAALAPYLNGHGPTS